MSIMRSTELSNGSIQRIYSTELCNGTELLPIQIIHEWLDINIIPNRLVVLCMAIVSETQGAFSGKTEYGECGKTDTGECRLGKGHAARKSSLPFRGELVHLIYDYFK